MVVCKVRLTQMRETRGPVLHAAPARAVQVAPVHEDPDQIVLARTGQVGDAVVQHEEPGQPRAVRVVLRLGDEVLK